MSRSSGRVFLALLLFCLCATFCHAQYSSSIQGVLTDSSGAAIAEAQVVLRNVNTGIEHTTTTSSSGNYSFPSLAPGHYLVRAEAKGLQIKEVDLTLGTAETQGVNITLSVASVTQTAVVTEQAQVIDPDDSRLQATLGICICQRRRSEWSGCQPESSHHQHQRWNAGL